MADTSPRTIRVPGTDQRHPNGGYPLPDNEHERAVLEAAGDFGRSVDLLYRGYGTALRGFCASRLEGDEGAVDDACHETLLRGAQALHRFRPGARPLWSWLATIAAHVCIDIERDRRRQLALRLPAPACQGEPDEELDRLCREAVVHDGLASLNPRYARYLYLHAVEGWTPEELAHSDDIRPSSARSVLTRARRAFARSVATSARGRGLAPFPAGVVLWDRVRAGFRRLRAAPYNTDTLRFQTGMALTPQALEIGVAVAVAVSVAVGGVSQDPGRREPTAVAHHVVLAAPGPTTEARPAPEPIANVRLADPELAVSPAAPAPGPIDPPPAPGSQPARPDMPSAPAVPEAPVATHVDPGLTERERSRGKNYDHTPVSVSVPTDVNEDGRDDVHASPTTTFYCPPEEERKTFTGTVCPVLESDEAEPLTQP